MVVFVMHQIIPGCGHRDAPRLLPVLTTFWSTWPAPRPRGFHQARETAVIIPLTSGEQGHAADRDMD